MQWLINKKELIGLLADMATILALIFTGIQLKNAIKEYRVNNEIEERKKAIELAEIYAEDLIHNISYLSNIYKQCGISKYFKDLNYREFRQFDIYELENFIKGKTTIEELKKLTLNIDLMILVNCARSLNRDLEKYSVEKIDIILLNNFINNDEKELESKKEVAAALEDGKENKNYKKSDIKEYNEAKMKYKTYEICYNDQFKVIECETLNKLEYFCMYFNSGIADEETVYQSLHQSFLDMVRVMYFRIASVNKTGKDKYYTNIIDLYNKWSERDSKLQEKEIEAKRKTTHKKSKIKK